MMSMKRPFPRDIPQNPSEAESAAYLADLLEWLVSKRLPELRGAGFTDSDLFTLRGVARAYRQGKQTPDTHQDLYRLLDRLESVDVWL